MKHAIKALLKKFPDSAVSTTMELDEGFVFSLRPKGSPIETATGGVCYLVNKETNEIEACTIDDPRVRKPRRE